MQCVIAGSRGLTDPRLILAAVQASGFHITTVVSGCAHGIDQLGERYAEARDIPVLRFPAEWKRYGKSAGYRRNRQMLEHVAAAPEGGALLAIWDGHSRGTRHSIECAQELGIPTYIFQPGR